MARWRCPRCDREFQRTGQSHTCLPGNSVAETFAKRPEQRAIYDAAMKHLKKLGKVHADAVSVGVFLKTERKLAEFRPKTKWLTCYLFVEREIHDARIARTLKLGAHRYMHEVKLRAVGDVDDQFCGWLSEAYDTNTFQPGSGGNAP
jgi:hypothetical protein